MIAETFLDLATTISPVDQAIEKLRSIYEKPDIRFTTDVMVAVRAYVNTLLAQDVACREQFEAWVKQKKQMTEALNNDRGMSEGEELKVCVNMPELLGLYICKQFPDIFATKKSLYKFMKEFPEFTVPKKAFSTKYDKQ